MEAHIDLAIGYCWAALGALWLLGMAFTKRVVRSQPAGPRVFGVAVAFLGFALLGKQWFRYGWLAERFVPETQAILMAGLVLTIGGCLFAGWARVALGGNWSGRATVKENHELIVRGPYAWVRHPIYTGLLVAVAGTALAQGEWRSAAGVGVIFLAFAMKMSQEERLMMQTFPQEYPGYRRRVKALIPGVF